MLNLPAQTTSLIGRETELAEIRSQLADPHCRLLTLVGPGGIGKTRLAVEVTARMDGFADGIHFVPLQPVASAELVVPAIATATGHPLAGKEPLLTQLLHNLRHKQTLLLLDNFEHLLPAADLLAEVLRDAPAVKLLVTSREVVGILEEWLYPIQGLSFPPTAAAIDPADYGAVQLFCTRARRVRRDFRWENEQEAVISICRHVEGNPLAVELAASWLSTLDSATFAAQLRQGLHILTSSLRDVPERHRSMRVVFDHSWQLLGEAERAVFARLTLFRGGFTLPAAQEVAGASLGDLSALVAKSLIRREADGRYQIHELLRQYGAEKLAASPMAVTQAHTAHAAYFIAYLCERGLMYDLGEQLRAARETAAEYENVHLAWRWFIDHLGSETQAEKICLALSQLTNYHQLRSRYMEGIEILSDTIHRLESRATQESHPAILAECLICFSWLAIRLGRLTEAEQALKRALDQIYNPLHPLSQHTAIHAQLPLMILALVRGDYGHATALAQEVRSHCQERHKHYALACYGSASAALAQGAYEEARRFAEQALTITGLIGNRRQSINAHDVLGQVARLQGELQTAKRHFEAAYAIASEFETPGTMAVHLKNLGDVDARQELWPEARTLYRQSLGHYQDIGDRGGAAAAERGLGIVSYHIGDLNGARRHLRQALDTAVATQSIPSILSILAAAGEFMVERAGTGRGQALGLRLLRFVAQHPSADRTTRDEAVTCLKRKGAPQDGSVDDTLELLTAALQTELTEAAEPALPFASAQTHSAMLVEALTPREAEVLWLLGAGRSNADIANEMIVAVGTVKAYTSSIYRKLDVANRTQAVARAHELGLLD